MVKAQTTKEQARIAKEQGCALMAFACKSGGTVSIDGPISHELAKPLIKLMSLVVLDRVPVSDLQWIVNQCGEVKFKPRKAEAD